MYTLNILTGIHTLTCISVDTNLIDSINRMIERWNNRSARENIINFVIVVNETQYRITLVYDNKVTYCYIYKNTQLIFQANDGCH